MHIANYMTMQFASRFQTKLHDPWQLSWFCLHYLQNIAWQLSAEILRDGQPWLNISAHSWSWGLKTLLSSQPEMLSASRQVFLRFCCCKRLQNIAADSSMDPIPLSVVKVDGIPCSFKTCSTTNACTMSAAVDWGAKWVILVSLSTTTDSWLTFLWLWQLHNATHGVMIPLFLRNTKRLAKLPCHAGMWDNRAHTCVHQ